MSTVEVEELLNNLEEADDDSFRMGSLEIAALLGHWKMVLKVDSVFH